MQERISRISFLQFNFFLSIGFIVPFFSLYYRNVLAFSDGRVNYSVIGTILFLQSVVGLVSPPIAGILSDKFKIRNRLITLFSILTAFGGLLSAIPAFPGMQKMDIATRITFILPGAILIGFATKPIFPLLDTEALAALAMKYNSTDRYGAIRLFGSIGWIISASLAGFIALHAGNLLPLYLLFIGGFVSLSILGSTGISEKIEKVKLPLKLLREDRKVQLLLIFIFTVAIGMNGSFMFTSLYMSELNVGINVIGLAYGLAAIPEVFILSQTKRIIPRFGLKWMMLAGDVVLLIKLLLFTFIGTKASPLFFILIQSLHGIAFPLLYVSWISYLNEKAHRDLKATYQNINQFVFTLGSALGNFLVSLIVGALGVRWMMGFSAGIIVISLCLFFLFSKIFAED